MLHRIDASAGDDPQLTLPLTPLRNSDFLSSHWLEHRLPLEPEWEEKQEDAERALNNLVAVWKVERDRVALYGDEAGLEEKFIQPVFEILGWKLKYQAYLDRREPDYALFTDDHSLDGALQAGRKTPEFWSHVSMVADAKAWHISLDRPTRVGSRREYPPEQIEWYLNRSLCDFGILTNGKLWRLIPRVLGPSKPRFQTYLELDLPALLDSILPAEGDLDLGPTKEQLEIFRCFYLLFGQAGSESADDRKPLVVRAVEGSSEYSLGVGEELRDRVFEALRLCVEGFITHEPNGLDPDTDLGECQEHSFIFLYRLLFILYAEDRGLLPYRTNQTYTKNRSLARHRDEVAVRLDQYSAKLRPDYDADGAALWDDLNDLFDLIDRGHRRYGVQAYNGGLFDLEADSFLAKMVLPDPYIARILDQLGRSIQPGRPDLGLFRVDYRDLAIQQLGSVYEGLLELRPQFAQHDIRVLRSTRTNNRSEIYAVDGETVPRGYQATDTVYKAGSVYLATDKGERRKSGSYYTPDHIVDHMVQKALGEKCGEIFANLETQISDLKTAASAEADDSLAQQIEILEGSFDDRILELKVLDPSMGSGHFLIRACQYLAEEIATNPYTADPEADDLAEDESTITFWKRRVAENCLFGVDVNPMAVELAKLAIWLETVAADAPLTFLDHHLQCGDSIIGARIESLDTLPRDSGLFEGHFSEEVQAALPKLVGPLQDIHEIHSTSVENVKAKEQIYRRRFKPVHDRFSLVADLWVAEAMAEGCFEGQQYAEIVDALGTQKRFSKKISRAWVQNVLAEMASKNIRPFHWELAFPEVFLQPAAEREKGFDVITGNPPYDVLSEKEIGENIDYLKSYILQDRSLSSSMVGKNNLYKLFICRSVELLKDNGLFSFIVPMALLGDEQAREIRRLLIDAGDFREIHAFPQKDNANQRIFRDAKLSTTFFLYKHQRITGAVREPFVSSVHPGRDIEKSSPTLKLNSNSITSYDPSNLTIVSCDQADWDLAASIDDSNIARLGEFVEYFQGEVNQTVATRNGHLTSEGNGPLVTRGACICLYKLREASQGDDIYLNVAAYLDGKKETAKAFHHRFARVGVQESSPQNNFRRIISCRIDPGQFCNHTINYTTEEHSDIDLELILFVHNSLFAEWYFRLGSTNAHVSHYQLKNIPCPTFGRNSDLLDSAFVNRVERQLSDASWEALESDLLGRAKADGCSQSVEYCIKKLVGYIEQQEDLRGDITRTERSSLSPNGIVAQGVLDKLYLVLIGLDEQHVVYLRDRLGEML